MKIPERTGQWVEVTRAPDSADEIVITTPNGMWAAWMTPFYVKEQELAAALRSFGWEIDLPATLKRESAAQHTH